ncbi:hypothetical protein PPERSA_06619 [Pseudocohnilembus persalinus]|uniref:RING-type domain-containing protein n=1 Tax=Pseudocohnilembus persalinus TaxID=266149 RepID=A0A0V0QRS4_PSEPJ|nr:hypothetical protein PPERSA_06619 [Pseudocohnilembus persalinus]|eukprot:KRX04985.1 hypothetical protein PPERSA_06619 [Pseudocohnilembus persalinus]
MDTQMSIQELEDYINNPEMQTYINKNVFEPQALSIIEQLCQKQAILNIKQIGTTQCNLCEQHILPKGSSINHQICMNSCHVDCFKTYYSKNNPNLEIYQPVNCPSCQVEYFPEEIYEAYGGANQYKKIKEDQKVYTCYVCQNEGKIGDMVTHFCDQNIHKKCLQDMYIKENPSLNPQNNIVCEICNMNFEIEQIELAFLGKEKLQQKRDEIDKQFIDKLEQEDKQKRQEEAQNRCFECQICMGEANINEDARTLDNCLHQYCKDCLREHILQSKDLGKIECPICQDTPIEERQFPDPNIPVGEKHDPKDIEIKLPIVKDLLTKEEFQNLSDLWTRKFYRGNNDKFIIIQCPGFIKKRLYNDQNEAELIIPEKTQQKMLYGMLQGLGFEFNNCQAMYEFEKADKKITKHKCEACKLEFCPQCKDVGHEKTCEDYKKWKEENSNIDEALQELIRKNPKIYKRCPKCKSLIMKSDGCNRVPCASKGCGAHICWICDQYFDTSRKGYDHIEKQHKGMLWK